MRILADVVGFEWDDGNRDKNLKKHGVTNGECEESFGDQARVVHEDIVHSKPKGETRNYLIGKTNRGRLLYISFTIRSNLVRVISARDINKKERILYEK